ncbi:MAG: carboxypeptidase-like regulatory domain-containing protein [Acidobacteriota bacterium]
MPSVPVPFEDFRDRAWAASAQQPQPGQLPALQPQPVLRSDAEQAASDPEKEGDGAVVEGVLLTADGAPIAGWVRLGQRVVTTEDDGVFRFGGLPTGEVEVRAGGPHGAYLQAAIDVPAAGLRELELRLPGRQRIVGRVVRAADNTPVVGAQILDGRFGLALAVSDADGAFVAELPARAETEGGSRARGDLRVEAEGLAPAAVYLTGGAGTAEEALVILLAEPARLLVRVVDAEGAVVDGPLRVQAFGGAPPTTRSATGSSPLRLEDLPAGTWQLLIESTSRQAVSRTVGLEGGQELELDVVLEH